MADPERLAALALTVIRRKVSDSCRKLKRVAAVHDAVARVPAGPTDAGREVIEFRLQGLDAPEIAARVGGDAPAVRVRLSRVRAKLRAAGCDERV